MGIKRKKHSLDNKKQKNRQNLSAPWFVCPRTDEGEFRKFGDFESLKMVVPEDYSFYGVRITPFCADFINIEKALQSIPNFNKNIISFREMMLKPGKTKLNDEEIFEQNSLDINDFPEGISAFSPRFWFGNENENESYESLFKNVPELPELKYDMMMMKFPSAVILEMLKDPLLEDYTQSTHMTSSQMVSEPYEIRSAQVHDELEQTILPTIMKEVKKKQKRRKKRN